MEGIRVRYRKDGKPSYEVRYRDPHGRQRQMTFRRNVDARHFRVTVEAAKHTGTYINPTDRTTFLDMADTWMSTRRKKAQSTLDRDRSYLSSLILPTFGDMAVAAITAADIEVWLGSLDRAPSTCLKAFHTLRAVLELARRKKLISANPARDVDPPSGAHSIRRRVALEDDQIRDVIAAAEEIDERTALLVYLMVRCGLRSGEAIALQRRDVDLVAGTVSVTKSMSRREGLRPVKGKTIIGDGRTIPLPTDVRARIERHLRESPVVNLDGHLVSSPRGGPISYGNWRRRVWNKITERVGIDFVPHDLRRTTVTRLFLEDGWTPAEVQQFVGHSDSRMTLDVYTTVKDEQLRRPTELAYESA